MTGLENLDLEPDNGSATVSFSDDGTTAGLNYIATNAGTSFSSDRAEHASDAEWASLNNPVHEGKSRVFKVLSNVLEKDAPLDFSISTVSLSGNQSSPQKVKGTAAVIAFTPLGDIPAAPAAPTSVAEAFATAQFHKARHLFSVGMTVDPQHGPLYHAYGNMELVSLTSNVLIIHFIFILLSAILIFLFLFLLLFCITAPWQYHRCKRCTHAWHRDELQ
jgi:hypothetical protein